MNTIIKRVAWLLLSLALLVSFSACHETGPDTNTDVPPVATAEGVVNHGKVAQDDLPTDPDFIEWYTMACEREQLTNALYYAQDDAGLWHCWLYIGEDLREASFSIATNTESGFCVVLRCNGNTAGELGAEGAYYFTVDCDEEPAFELFINGEFAGMLQTLAVSAVPK